MMSFYYNEPIIVGRKQMTDQKIHTLVFDWGNTLMVDFPHYHGKMKDWPEVKVIEGVKATLAKLSHQFNIVLATNAEDSCKKDIEIALQRGNLDQYFSKIFNFQELKVKKPALEFFYKIQSSLNCHPEEIAMIGDDYITDMIGAKKAGWKAIWFNPKNNCAPAHLPFHDQEMNQFELLEEILQKPFYPDIQTCYQWYIESGVTHTLLAHVLNVAAISYQIAIWMRDKGYPVNPVLAHRGGFLHDLAKLKDESQKNHGVLAAEILSKKNQIELSEIARRHLIGNLLSEDNRPQTWEEKIVNYADKLSEGSSVVSLEERLLALQQRYPNFAEKIRKNTPLIKALENEILEPLGCTPEVFLKELKTALFNGS